MIHAFPFQDLYLLLDVESGAIHTLDRDAYLVARALETGTDPLAAGVPLNEANEILSEFSEMQEDGSFDAKTPDAPEIPGGSVVKSLCLHVAHDCNLRCKYCFASTGDFHGARMLMPFEVAKQSIDFLMAHSGRRKHLEVDLFGGEPLMNYPVCEAVVAYGREQEKKFGKEIHFTMTTNCVALDPEKIDFINREMHNVVISLDGRKHVHDALRPTVNGKGSYDIILKKALALAAGRTDKEYYVRGTFTRNNLDFTEDVRALVDAGFTQISVEPVVLPEESPYSLLPEHLPRIQAEYGRLAEYYLEQRKSGKWFNFFHFMVDMENGPCLRKRLSGCGCGTEYVAITPDGDVYPCHQFVGQTDWKLGNVADGALDEKKQGEFASCNVATKPACKDCWAKYFCSGGCSANAYLYNGSIMEPHRMSCALMRMRTECAIGIHVKEQA